MLTDCYDTKYYFYNFYHILSAASVIVRRATVVADSGWLVCMQNAVEASKSRLINFVGEFEAVKWKCRAPLPNGKLCERMDRHKVSHQCIVLISCC